MKAFRNIIVGFGISFIGSIPLGYLNVIGYRLYHRTDFNSLVAYLLGVMIIESLVIYCTLAFAQRISKNEKLMKYIEFFSILFMIGMAYYFRVSSSNGALPDNESGRYESFSPFFKGLAFSCINFMQVPFWTGWNIYLVNEKYITAEKKYRLPYVGGSSVGTFSGMLVFILLLDLIVSRTGFLSTYLMPVIIPILFLGMAIYQSIKFYLKYYRK